MAIFDEPSRKPLPQPNLQDVGRAGIKGLLAMVPLLGGPGSELLGLLSSPVAQRRDDWFADLERRLHDLEGRVDGFRFDDLGKSKEFVSATLQATQAAIRTHQSEKLEALRNAVMNVALSKGPSEDLQLMFLNLVDTFTPIHLQILAGIQCGNRATLEHLRNRRDETDQAICDLRDRGLITDPRPYAARNRDSPDALIYYDWDVTNMGKQFLEFITAPEVGRP